MKGRENQINSDMQYLGNRSCISN